MAHGWQSAVACSPTREHWRAFLRRKEEAKHRKYDQACERAHWSFGALAFGTWGGLGPKAVRLITKLTKRAAGWQEGEHRASLQESLRFRLGFTIISQVSTFLEAKNMV